MLRYEPGHRCRAGTLGTQRGRLGGGDSRAKRSAAGTIVITVHRSAQDAPEHWSDAAWATRPFVSLGVWHTPRASHIENLNAIPQYLNAIKNQAASYNQLTIQDASSHVRPAGIRHICQCSGCQEEQGSPGALPVRSCSLPREQLGPHSLADSCIELAVPRVRRPAKGIKIRRES